MTPSYVTGSFGTQFNVMMTGADVEDLENNEVLIGGQRCNVVIATETHVGVTVGVTPSGTHPVIVRVSGKGAARMTTPLTFTVVPTLTEMSRFSGSMGGK